MPLDKTQQDELYAQLLQTYQAPEQQAQERADRANTASLWGGIGEDLVRANAVGRGGQGTDRSFYDKLRSSGQGVVDTVKAQKDAAIKGYLEQKKGQREQDQLDATTKFRDLTTAETARHNLEMEKIGQTNANKANTPSTKSEIGRFRIAEDGSLFDSVTGETKPGVYKTPKMLPEDQRLITDLSAKNAGKISVMNQIDGYAAQFDNAKTDAEKLAIGNQMMKTLNSPEGADAIGAEEVSRLGGKLKFAMGNLTNDNPTQFGRDLPGFREQVRATRDAIKFGVDANDALIKSKRGATPTQKDRINGMLNQAPSAPQQSNGKTVVKTFVSKSTGKTKVVYSDGSEEIK